MTPQIEALERAAGPAALWAVGSADAVHAARPGTPSTPEGDGGADGDWNAPLDAGAMTPLLALWPVIGGLVARGELTLHTPLTAYGETAAAGLPGGTTAHHLLTRCDGPAPLDALTRLAEHLTGTPLADCARTRVWEPLGMTRTRFAGTTLRTCPADLARFLRHLLSAGDTAEGSVADRADPAGTADPADAGAADAERPVSRAWTAESLRIRTGELTPSRGLLWHPAPAGVWTHHPPSGSGPAVWISPRQNRWALLVPGPESDGSGPPRAAFREAAFGPAPARAARGADVR
ncbi:hypothetical protein EF910_35755 [Streptomyces sp. WAC07149]|uniref:serine hydrolase n=1 Tax=Streptomyces sp. WAC07149 TaxID=2487425 RepID=UPI000F7B85CF|nr:serine hydrolase [Streptomyces sp. WAC07149]RSS99387.1 hypothetical protein EF910_35755 [Streptomyces sp. WAC07149]